MALQDASIRPGLGFLAGGGDAGARLRGYDWSSHPLGSPERWPQPLKTTVGLMLSTGHPMCVSCGPDLAFYNDAYAPFLAARHPWALGRPIAEVWADIWADIAPLIGRAMAGEAVWQEDLHLVVARSGYQEDTWWTFSYSPLRDEAGTVIGVVVICNEMTGKVQNERRLVQEREALRESEARFRALINASSNVVYRMSADWTELRQLDGRGFLADTENPSVKWLDEYLFPEDRPRIEAALESALRTRGAYELEHRVRRIDGTAGWTFSRAVPVLDAEGEVAEWFGMASDVTERVAAETALRESEERYRTLFRTIDEGFCVIEFLDGPQGPMSDYVHVEANTAFRATSGLPDSVGKRLRELVSEVEADRWAETYRNVLLTGTPTRIERELVETGRHLEVAAFRIEPPSRRQVAVLFRDMTPRKRAELALRELNETLEVQVAARTAELRRFRDIIEALASPVCAFDTEYRLIAFNKAHSDGFFRIFGHRVQLGEVFPDLFPPDQAPIMRGFMTRALAGERYTIVEEFGDPKLVKPYWEVHYTPLRDAGGRVIGAFHLANDISARLRAEAELERAQEALRQSQKMEAVGQLTGGLAHDFNNLLAGISGSLELVQGRLQLGRFSDVGRFVEVAQSAAKRAAGLTHRLLAFSRRQTLDPKPTDVNRLIRGMEDMIQRAVGPAINVDVVGARELWPARVDSSQLENSLLNLCLNSRDAMPDGGHITVETANRVLDAASAQRQDMPEGEYLSMCVTDTGAGMPPEVIARAFEPFFTTKPLGEGTGLGLSMIYGFAKQSGGQVRIHSQPGKGTTVCIYLPRHHGAADEETRAAKPGVLPRSEEGAMVLIVDDEPSVRILLVDILDQLGYTPIEASDSKAGLKILQSEARIDLLVSDVGLPGGMNGRQMADAARIKRPDLKVLFVTGYAENAVFADGHLAPGMAVMTKPFSVDTMAARIRGLIDAD